MSWKLFYLWPCDSWLVYREVPSFFFRLRMNPPMYKLSSFGWNFSRFVCFTLWVSSNHSLKLLTHRSVFLVLFLFLCSMIKSLSLSSIRSYPSGELSAAICGGSIWRPRREIRDRINHILPFKASNIKG